MGRMLSTTAAAGLLALTLAVSAATGAVAARMITGDDIKDGSVEKADLGKGSVGWKGELTDRTRQRIKDLAGRDGATGPAGPAGVAGAVGPAGPAGPRGADGTDGSDGAALAGYGIYLNDAAGDPTEEMYPALGDPIALPAGSYLVTVNTLSFGPAFFSVGAPLGIDELTLLHGCYVYDAIPLGFPVGECGRTFPFEVLPGDAGLPLYVETGDPDGVAAPPTIAEVTVMSLGGDLPDCTCPRAGHRAERLFDRFLAQHRGDARWN